MLWWKYQQLRMGNAESRLTVVEQLAFSGDGSAVGPLIFALKDKEPNVRCAAAKMLTRFNDKRAIEPLIQMLRDKVPQARAAAGEALGLLGDPTAINRLLGLLRDPDTVVRTMVARSLIRLGWKPETNSQRVQQILAMGNLNQLADFGPEGVSPLLELLQNGPPNKQSAAIKALGEIKDPRVLPAMLEALGKPSATVRIAALGVLEQLAEPEAYAGVEKLLQDPDASVRGAAVEAATRCGGARAVPDLLKCLKDESWEVRQAAANALGYFGERSAVDGLCELINDPDRDVRESVINALGHIFDRRAVAPLVMALLDPESAVRNAATATLQRLDRHWHKNEHVRQLVPKISNALKHKDYWVRHSAGQLLEKLKPEGDTASLLKATPAAARELPVESATPHPAAGILADLLFDRDRDLRLAAACAFGRLRDKSAGPMLTAALRDTDFLVQEAAQQALTALNWFDLTKRHGQFVEEAISTA